MAINNILMNDFRAGELNRRTKRFNFPDRAVSDGLNVMLADGGFHIRPGTSLATLEGSNFEPVAALLTPRAFATACWDPSRNRVILFGGVDEHFNSLIETLAYDPETDEWTDLQATGEDLMRESISAYAVSFYVPTTDLFWFWDGYNHWVLNYDPESNQWSQLETSGTAPISSHQRHACWRSIDGCMWSFNQDSLQYAFKLDLSSGVWTRYETVDWVSMTNMGSTQMIGAYDSETDSFIMTGGDNIGTASYDFATNTWIQKASLPLPWNYVLFEGTAVVCSGKFIIVGGENGLYNQEVGNTDLYIYDIAADAWEAVPYESGYLAKEGPARCPAGDYGIFVAAGRTLNPTVYRNDVWFVHIDCGQPVGSGLPVKAVVAMANVRFPTNEVSYIVVQVNDGSASALYAAPIVEGSL